MKDAKRILLCKPLDCNCAGNGNFAKMPARMPTQQQSRGAEETIAYMRKLLEQQSVKIQRINGEIKRLRAANERLRKALEESTLYVKRLAIAPRHGGEAE
jgi:hypothetical protein